MAKEPAIAVEGDYPNGVVMIRAGFARMTQRVGDGHRTLNYLGSGRVYGFEEIAHNWRQPENTVPPRMASSAVPSPAGKYTSA